MRRMLSYGLLISLIFFGLFFAGCMKNEKTLTPDNSAPLINFFDLYPQTVVRLNTVSVAVNYTDPDGDNVDFSISADSGNPAVGTLTKIDSTHFKWFAPQTGGRYWFKAVGNDGNFQTESIFSIIVLSRPPEVEMTNSPTPQYSYDSYSIPNTFQGSAISKNNYAISVVDLDEPPTTTISASVSMTTSDTTGNGALIASHAHLAFIDFNDTDVITIPNGDANSAVIVAETSTRIISLQTVFYCDTYADIMTNSVTFMLQFDFVDESGYANSVTRELRVYP